MNATTLVAPTRNGGSAAVAVASLWYGLRPSWQIAVEAAARREHGADLRLLLHPDKIIYQVPVELPIDDNRTDRDHLSPVAAVSLLGPAP